MCVCVCGCLDDSRKPTTQQKPSFPSGEEGWGGSRKKSDFALHTILLSELFTLCRFYFFNYSYVCVCVELIRLTGLTQGLNK